MAELGIICQGCGIEAPSKYIEFHQNIGMLIARQHRAVKGNLCKRCIHANFWKTTLTTLGIGWLGTISVIIAPILIIQNIVRYVGASKLAAVPPDAKPPVLTEAAIDAINSHGEEIISRLNAHESLSSVAREIGPRAGVTPGQVVRYVIALDDAARRQAPPPQRPTYGFPVQPVAAPAPVAVLPVAQSETAAPLGLQ